MLVQSHKANNWSVRQGDLPAHGETTPPIEWISASGKNPADTICTGPGCNKRIQKEIPNWRSVHFTIPIKSSTSEIWLPESPRMICLVSVELVDQVTSILEGFEQLPACAYVAVSSPLNKVVYLAVTLPTVKNLFNHSFLWIINYYWMWFRRWLFYPRGCVVIALGHWENVVIVHCFWQVWFVSILVDDLTYGIRSSAFVVDCLGWSSLLEVSSRESNFVPNYEDQVLSANIFWFQSLGFQQVLSEKSVSLFHPRYCCIC